MSKLIAVSDRVYAELKSRKNSHSFSEVIMGLYSRPNKTPLDVIENWNPDKRLIDGFEKAFSERGKIKLKKECL
jgi:predicted CopG family antitoxin